MTQHGETIDYNGFHIQVLRKNDRYEAWAERKDQALIMVGYGIAPRVGTMGFADPDAALAEAKAFIDKGQWKPHNKN